MIHKTGIIYAGGDEIGENLFKWPLTGDSWNMEEHTLNTYQNVGSFTQFSGALMFDPSQTVGEEYTISFWAKSPNGLTRLFLYNQNGAPKYFYFTSTTLTTELGDSWQYFTHTVINTKNTSTNASTNQLHWKRIEIYAPSQTGVLVKGIKVEHGSHATPWTMNENDWGFVGNDHGFIERFKGEHPMSVYEGHYEMDEIIEY